MSVGELQDMIFSVVRQQLNNHYKGLVNAYLSRFDADNTALLDGLDEVLTIASKNTNRNVYI